MMHWYQKLIITICIGFFASGIFAFPSVDGIQEYQPNVLQYPDIKQVLDDDIVRYRNADDIWAVMRQEFSLEHYENDPQVQMQIEWFLAHQDFLTRSITRAAPYLYYILQQARIRHLPIELVLLPIIESAYNPYAYSPAGASGIWQLMPGTASGYGIKQDRWYDGRRDVIASTKAALNYLSYLGTFFDNNWLLAMAAYDTGLGNVSYAINRNIREGYDTDFWSLRLAQETRIYVPRMLALAAIVANPDRYPVYLPPIPHAPYLAQLSIGMQMDLRHVALYAGVPYKQLMQLNSGFSHPITDPSGKRKLILPLENVAQFSANLQQPLLYPNAQSTIAVNNSIEDDATQQLLAPVVASSKSKKSARTVLASAQAPTEITSEDIGDFNHYLASKEVDGSRATAPAENYPSPPPAVKKELENLDGNYRIQPGDTIYMTREGDDIDKIAQRFHVSTQALFAANPLNATKTMHQDQHLVIPTHLRNVQIAKVVAPTPKKYHLASGDTVYMVRKGDTIDKIARKFHITAPEIRITNLIADNDLRDGDRLIIPTHA